MDAFYLALMSAIAWGIAPIFGKLGLRTVDPLDGLAARTLITVTLVFGWAGSRGGLAKIGGLSLAAWLFIAVEAVLATVAGDFAYYAALKAGGAGETASVLAASPLITLWLSIVFLGERPDRSDFLGALLIVAGIILLGRQTIR